jgi:heme o synthase
MPTNHTAHLEVPTCQRRPTAVAQAFADYWALTKPDVNLLIAIVTSAGFYLGYPVQSGGFPVGLLFHTVVGTMLVSGGTGTLNQFVERGFDAQMRRTSRRPIASGRIEPRHALCFGISLLVVGTAYLASVNLLVSLLAALTTLTYLAVYTPLKRKTPLCTLVGAFPGAVPPLIGWAAARGTLSLEAWVLYSVVFLWQFPHFMAIAWIYRKDYERAGYIVLPGDDRKTSFMVWQSILPSLVLVGLSGVATFKGHEGVIYFGGAFLCSVWLLYYASHLALVKTNTAARRLLIASVVYLPVVFVFMILDRLCAT